MPKDNVPPQDNVSQLSSFAAAMCALHTSARICSTFHWRRTFYVPVDTESLPRKLDDPDAALRRNWPLRNQVQESAIGGDGQTKVVISDVEGVRTQMGRW